MIPIPSRHKSLVLLAGVVVAQVLALAIQIKSTDAEGKDRSLIRSWTVAAISPFERAGSWMFGRVHGTWNHYFALRSASYENERLRKENDALKLELLQAKSKAAEAQRLATLLNFRQSQSSVPMVAARVIGGSADTVSETIFIDRGGKDGIHKDMGVITPDGVVGKVIAAYRDTSQVLLLTDKDSGVGAMILESRIQKPVGGTGEPLLVMKYFASDDTVNSGEHVVTSGMDRIFPKDLPVGTIVEVKPGNPFKQIRVRPAAGLAKLEEVLVLLTLKPLEVKPEAPAQDSSAAQSEAEKPRVGKR